MKSIISILLIILLLVVFACEKEISWPSPEGQDRTIVVEGILTNEYKFHEIKLSLTGNDVNGVFLPASGAIVKVSNSIDTVLFTESVTNSGVYIGDYKFAATLNSTYYLSVLFETKLYEANTSILPVNNSNSFSVSQVTGFQDLYQIDWLGSGYSANEQSMFEVNIDWTDFVDSTLVDSITVARLFYYTFNTIDVSYNIFPQDKEQVFFPYGSQIIGRKYSLTDDYAAYLRALLASTEWQGSLFEDARANLPTNISNHGLGYFSACSVLTDTLIAQ